MDSTSCAQPKVIYGWLQCSPQRFLAKKPTTQTEATPRLNKFAENAANRPNVTQFCFSLAVGCLLFS
jgi:hypothetical protein